MATDDVPDQAAGASAGEVEPPDATPTLSLPIVSDQPVDFSDALESIEEYLLGEVPSLTRVEVAERAGTSIELAKELWRLLGFPQQSDEEIAFTPADAEALESTQVLMRLGVLSPDSQAALVRTWGRSFARLAEWEAALLGDVVLAGGDPEAKLGELAAEVIPRVEALQSYIWRRHLAAAASRMLDVNAIGSTRAALAICFVDIVGYTSRSKSPRPGRAGHLAGALRARGHRARDRPRRSDHQDDRRRDPLRHRRPRCSRRDRAGADRAW